MAQVNEQALQHGWAIRQAMMDNDVGKFGPLLMDDPVLTKKAFVALLKFGAQSADTAPETSGQALQFAKLLAIAIETMLKDREPQAIVDLILKKDNSAFQRLENYEKLLNTPIAHEHKEHEHHLPQERLTSAQALPLILNLESSDSYEAYPTMTVASESLDSTLLSQIRPYFATLSRLNLAVVFREPKLIYPELDRYSSEKTRLVQQLKTFPGSEKRLATKIQRSQESLALIRLEMLEENGLLQDFEELWQKSYPTFQNLNTQAASLYLGFRLALNQADQNRARAYSLDLTKLTQSAELSPIFDLCAHTAEFQLSQLTRQEPEPEEILAAFRRAWDTLAPYRAFTHPSQDESWHYGQTAVTFWLQELGQIGPQGDLGRQRIMLDFLRYFGAAVQYRGYKDYGSDNLVLHHHEVKAHLSLTLNVLNVVLAALEHGGKFPKGEDPSEFLTTLNPILDGFELIPSKMGLSNSRLQDTQVIRELRTRIHYILALQSDTPLPHLQRAAELVETLQRPEPYIDYHLKLGHQFKATNHPVTARDLWKKAQSKADAHKFTLRSIEASALLAQDYSEAGQNDLAVQYAQKALDHLKSEVAAGDPQAYQSLGARYQPLVNLVTLSALQEDQPEQALQTLSDSHQVSRAATQLGRNPSLVKPASQLQVGKKRIATLERKKATLETLPPSSERDNLVQKTGQLLAQSRSDFLLQSRQIRRDHAELHAKALRFDPLDLPDIQTTLPKNSAVVQYFPTEQALYIFLVTPQSFRLRSVPVGRRQLGELVLKHARHIQRPAAKDVGLAQVSRELHSLLLEPLAEDLEGVQQLIIIPSGRLNILPFCALVDPSGRPLLAQKTVVQLAKTTDFLKIAQSPRKTASKVVAFVNATNDLPSAELEGNALARIYPDTQLFRTTAANKANVLKFGSQADILHMATHGTWDASNSLNNHLKLAEGQQLAQDDIFSLDLRQTSLVTLSACNTALADRSDLDHVASLAEAFWLAGSRTVIASLWPVDDNSTQALMSEFYTRLKAGESKAEALRAAQLSVRKNKKFQHPYFWSGFLLFGDYR